MVFADTGSKLRVGGFSREGANRKKLLLLILKGSSNEDYEVWTRSEVSKNFSAVRKCRFLQS